MPDINYVKVDHRRRTMKLLDEKFERSRIEEDLRYYNLKAFLEIQNEEVESLKALLSSALKRVEQLEVEAKVHPLKKLVGVKAKKEQS